MQSAHLHSQDDVSKGHVVTPHSHLTPGVTTRGDVREGGVASGQGGEVTLSQPHQLLVVNP